MRTRLDEKSLKQHLDLVQEAEGILAILQSVNAVIEIAKKNAVTKT